MLCIHTSMFTRKIYHKNHKKRSFRQHFPPCGQVAFGVPSHKFQPRTKSSSRNGLASQKKHEKSLGLWGFDFKRQGTISQGHIFQRASSSSEATFLRLLLRQIFWAWDSRRWQIWNGKVAEGKMAMDSQQNLKGIKGLTFYIIRFYWIECFVQTPTCPYRFLTCN